MSPHYPPRGIYVPCVAFFHEDETIDFEAIRTHITRIAKAGVDGLVIQGSNGEAMHMSHEERIEVLKLARSVLDEHGKPGATIIAGGGAQSTRESIQLCKEAHEAGADYALVLSPSYWVPAMQKPVIYKFFDDVAAASPIPILLYNFPGVTGGIDLDSDLIASLAAGNKNVVGCKLTCGNMGKLQRVAHDPRVGADFAAFAGKTDFMLHGLVGGSRGVIAATANLVPKLHTLMLRLYDEGRLREAQDLQTRFSRADWVLVQLGVAGLKAALHKYYGYGLGRSRRPLGSVDMAKFDGEGGAPLRDLVEQENTLPDIR
ncbi:dihydrodipicolinate synthase [Cordyceps javanica]|uniref:Dihydrodipicolinate synthase n=1 Tax=Cordyceps javanica TaxID=43265 RepID=A0A545UN81_9HYPO|nr:dihydrodipicolinate synthase [Cordyceps javanica]TQW02671.1 dihydrodipicolinate synthase [Cordyceps javanica]